jgi:hypothetical protein
MARRWRRWVNAHNNCTAHGVTKLSAFPIKCQAENKKRALSYHNWRNSVSKRVRVGIALLWKCTESAAHHCMTAVCLLRQLKFLFPDVGRTLADCKKCSVQKSPSRQRACAAARRRQAHRFVLVLVGEFRVSSFVTGLRFYGTQRWRRVETR